MAVNYLYLRGLGPKYIKKKDVKEYVLRYNKFTGLIIVFMSLVSPITTYFIYPRLSSLYSDLGVPIPFVVLHITFLSIIIFTLGILLALKIVFRGSEFVEYDPDYLSSENNDMVDVNKYTPRYLELVVLAYLGISVGFLVFSIIQPIYALTNSF